MNRSVIANQPPHPVQYLIPYPENECFVARHEEVEHIYKSLFVDRGNKKLAITGMRGMGKSQIALKLAYHVKEKNPECSIFWMSGISGETMHQGMIGITYLIKTI